MKHLQDGEKHGTAQFFSNCIKIAREYQTDHAENHCDRERALSGRKFFFCFSSQHAWESCDLSQKTRTLFSERGKASWRHRREHICCHSREECSNSEQTKKFLYFPLWAAAFLRWQKSHSSQPGANPKFFPDSSQ